MLYIDELREFVLLHTVLGKQRLVVDLEREAATEVVHVALREVEASVLGVVVGSLAHEHGAVPAVALPRRACAPSVVGPAWLGLGLGLGG
jgi:hypothetical protein